MTETHTFKALIQDAGSGGAYVEVPFDVEAAFGAKRPRVKALIEQVPYRGTLARMGGKRHLLIILKDIRQQIGKTIGDEVTIAVELDREPRVVAVPADLAAALQQDPAVQARFEKLAYSHQKEYVAWIDEAKKPETRQRRIAKTIEKLNTG
jgi:hypothetical protein